MFACGLSWVDLPMPVLDSTASDPLLPSRSFARLGFPPLLPDCSALDLLMFLRSPSCLGLLFLAYGLSRFGSSASVLDMIAMGSSTSLRSLAQLGFSLFVLDFLYPDPPMPLRSMSRLGSSLLLLASHVPTCHCHPLIWHTSSQRH